MGKLFVLVGAIYAVALLIQMLSYTKSAQKTAPDGEEGLEANGVVADQGCY